MAGARFLFVTLDCADPQRLAVFWSALLGTPVGGSWAGGEHTLDTFTWRTLGDPEGNEFDVAVG